MASSFNSALSAESLLNLMVRSLPAGLSEESRPVVKDAYAAVGLFAHACMLAVGFRLIGLGEDHKIGTYERYSGLFTRTHGYKMHLQIPRMFKSCQLIGTPLRHMPLDMLTHNPRWSFW